MDNSEIVAINQSIKIHQEKIEENSDRIEDLQKMERALTVSSLKNEVEMEKRSGQINTQFATLSSQITINTKILIFAVSGMIGGLVKIIFFT